MGSKPGRRIGHWNTPLLLITKEVAAHIYKSVTTNETQLYEHVRRVLPQVVEKLINRLDDNPLRTAEHQLGVPLTPHKLTQRADKLWRNGEFTIYHRAVCEYFERHPVREFFEVRLNNTFVPALTAEERARCDRGTDDEYTSLDCVRCGAPTDGKTTFGNNVPVCFDLDNCIENQKIIHRATTSWRAKRT